jgi:hypothetical protein
MTCPPASVDWDTTGYGVHNLDPGRFGIVDADPRAHIWLESSKGESTDKVRHERARIDPSGHVALCNSVTEAIPQDEVSATSKAIVKEVAFDCWTKYSSAKDVTEFKAAKKPDIILGRDGESVIEIRIESVPKIMIAKRSVIAAVLKDIRSGINRSIETESVKFWWRRRSDLLVDFGGASVQRSGEESNKDCC